MDRNHAFGLVIRDLRAKAQKNQDELADDLEHVPGLKQPDISKIERGLHRSPEMHVGPLAAALGVLPGDITRRVDEMVGLAPAPVPQPSQAVGLDVEKLTDMVETVESAIAKSGKSISPRTKAKLIVAMYRDEHASTAASSQAVQAALFSLLASMEET
ncbi:helix-turn-helix domain-containing protein [Stenotrophomonas indicatrix]|uniref:helix-turn-helix domain-containing protein n=1 Tax=Stenotrophomonas indicatrix TaxID=2045451 RepID=UPI001AA165F8|nr:helix-turn-helix transcriptional regulator [Stenotrophomonas indicatrix]MBO1748927.1 helix-turn-helix transcriptional regulator [Stenotrophomonas indicatrix]